MKSARILVVTEIEADARLVRKLLWPDFKNISISTDPEQAANDFIHCRPDLLILAFNTLGKAETYYLGLYRSGKVVHAMPHRTLILCRKMELQRASELCGKQQFDDFVQFWPLGHDVPRLGVAVIRALRDLTLAQSTDQPGAQHGRGLSALERQVKPHDRPNDNGIDLAASGNGGVAPVPTLTPRRDPALAQQLPAKDCEPAVLIVDDDPFAHKLVQKILQHERYHLLFSTSGAQALSILHKEHVDLILLDIVMPEVSGLEVLRFLKATPQLATIPVIMITGQSDKIAVLDSLKAGAVDFVVKPLEREIFMKKVARVLWA